MGSHTMADQISDTLWRARKRTGTAVRHGRVTVADALDSAAASFSAGAEYMADAARAASDRMEASAKWVRTTRGRDTLRGIRSMIKAHPARTAVGAVGAVALGLLVVRVLRRR